MQPADLSIVSEIEAAINASSAEKSLQTVRRVTDLFLLSAGRLDDEQIALFDNVLDRLVKTIELRAIADVSARIALAELTTWSNSPRPSRSRTFWQLPAAGG